MGRRKTIDRKRILDAVEAVVQEAGPAALTVDAVAVQAGCSKASVLYDFGTKKALILAYVARRLESRDDMRNAALARHSESPAPWLSVMLDEAGAPPSEDEVAAAIQLTASLSSDDQSRETMKRFFEAERLRMREGAADPRRATLAWLALHGLTAMEHLGFQRFDPDTRAEMLADIRALIEAEVRRPIHETSS